MSTLNGWVIQEALKQEKRINVPWIQGTFAVPYLQAKEMLAEMVQRGWLQYQPKYHDWKVVHRNLFLRHLDPSETEALCEHLTIDCLSALECLQTARGAGVPYKDISDAVRGETDTRAAIRALTKLKLLFCSPASLYYSCIPERESRVLTEAVRQRMRKESARGHRDAEAELEDFRRVLWRAIGEGLEDLLFDDDDDDDFM